MPAHAPDVAVDGKPRLSGIMDTINASDAHGPETRLPAEFYDEKARAYADKMAVEEWYSGYIESSEYRRLGIGALLGDVVDNMVKTAAMAGWYSGSVTSSPTEQGQKAIRFALSGCHDTTVAGILCAVGAFENGKWPPFTSSVAIELFSKADDDKQRGLFSSLFNKRPAHSARIPLDSLPESVRRDLQRHYVRIRYNDQPVRIPGCAAKPENHLPGDDTFCTLDAFKAIVDKFTPKNWGAECMKNLGEGPFGKDDRYKEISGYY